MSAMQMKTATPVRDGLVAIAEALIEDARDSLGGFCADCRDMVEDRCDDHAPCQVIVDRYQPVVFKLWQVKADDDAVELVRAEPGVIAAMAQVTGMDERTFTDWLAVASGKAAAA